MTRSFAIRTLARGAALLCLSVACGLATLAQTGAAWTSPPTVAQNPADTVTLELGKPIERELSGGQKHFYQITLSQGQFLRMTVRAQSTPVAVTFSDPDGKVVDDSTPYSDATEENIEQVAESSGVYRLETHSLPKASPGRYEVRVLELRPATENERALQEARDLVSQYMRIRSRGKWSEASAYIERALEIRERVLGPDNLLVANTLGFVANNYADAGDYARAEPMEQRALQITEKVLGPDHPQMAQEVFHLAVDSHDRGNLRKAEELQQRAWSILEKNKLTETPMAAGVLEQLGNIHYDGHDYTGAENYYLKSRAVWEKILGPGSFHLSFSYTFSGDVAYQQGDYQKAEAMFQQALSLAEKGLGPEHLKVTQYVNDLAMLDCTTGAYEKGEELYRRVIALHEQKGAMGYPDAQTSLFGLARCFQAQGNWSEAVKLQSRASEIAEHYVAVNIAMGSEREKLAFLNDLSLRASRNISLQSQLARNDPAAIRLAVTTVLRNKGRVQDAVASSLTTLQQRLGSEDHKLVDQLDDLIPQLAKLVLNGPQRLAPAEYGQKIKTLEDEREQIEAELNRRTAGFYQGSKAVTLAEIQTAIPDDAALVEFAVYRPFDPKAPDNPTAYKDPHYVAYVVRHQGEVRWQELGDARGIDQAVDELRLALRDPLRKEKEVRQLARAVDERILQPLRSLAGNAGHLLISPDGKLNLIPFEALVDEQGRYMVQRYSITYLTTGRDLLRMRVVRENKSGPVVVADPFFGEPRTQMRSDGTAQLTTISAPLRRRNVIAAENLSGVYFAPLSGTAQEARVIQSLFPESQLLIGRQATKKALQQMVAPRILHIATHGFFLQDPKSDSPARNGQGRSSFKVADPLLRSGLALTGANLSRRGNEDGILTALEASNLNLWGTKLVTLSACETGLGEVKDGEGVYGLRRSFFLAGSESLVMSLWAVSDHVTREMMTSYYRGLKQGLGRGEALRQAELTMLKRKDRQHPFYWASFIQSGEWASLDGPRQK